MRAIIIDNCFPVTMRSGLVSISENPALSIRYMFLCNDGIDFNLSNFVSREKTVEKHLGISVAEKREKQPRRNVFIVLSAFGWGKCQRYVHFALWRFRREEQYPRCFSMQKRRAIDNTKSTAMHAWGGFTKVWGSDWMKKLNSLVST